MIKTLAKTVVILGVLSSLAGCITVQMGAQQRQSQPVEGYAQPINYGGKQQQSQQQGQQQQNGGCAPGSRRIGTNPNGGAHCQWDSPQQGHQQGQQQQGQQQQNGGGCAPGSHRIGTNPNGGAHCQWNSPQQGHQQGQQQQQQQQKNCNGAGYRDLTTGRFISVC